MKQLLLLIIYFSRLESYSQSPHIVVINEIMADPSPAVGLPGYEWIELFNPHDQAINLLNWWLGDGAGLSGPFPEFILLPKQYLILCAASARSAMQSYGQVISISSFPSLDNAGEILYLRSAAGQTIHAIRYTHQWHSNKLKQEGGWSLEMTDAASPCMGAGNWTSSSNASGGSPGTINSQSGSNPDVMAPQPLRTYHSANNKIAVLFNESLDSNHAVNAMNYKMDHGLQVIHAVCVPPMFDEVILETDQPLDSQLVYQLQLSGISDCSKNQMVNAKILKAGLPLMPSPGKCLINELLFNPRPNSYDYIEIYNPGPAIIDASQLYITNRNISGELGTPVRIITTPFAVFPGDYLVVTENAASLSMNYLVKSAAGLLELPSLPSLPDDRGAAVLLDFQGVALDEAGYDQQWHHQLISNQEGVALERIDPFGPSGQRSNWHSASSTAGYGTPGYQNSQYRSVAAAEAGIEVRPKVFSPDNDGIDDVVSIVYKTASQGFVANIFIFDAGGRQVKHLVRNELLGTGGYWNWNGTTDTEQPLPVGIYIVQAELFDLSGSKELIRRVVVLARRL